MHKKYPERKGDNLWNTREILPDIATRYRPNARIEYRTWFVPLL